MMQHAYPDASGCLRPGPPVARPAGFSQEVADGGHARRPDEMKRDPHLGGEANHHLPRRLAARVFARDEPADERAVRWFFLPDSG